VRGQILRGDSIPFLTVTFSKVMHVSTGADMSPAPSIEQSAMIFERDRGRGRDRDRDLEEDVAHLEVIVVLMVVDRLLVIRGSCNVSIAKEIASLRSAERSLVALNRHNWLMLILLPLVILVMFILQFLTLVLLALPLLFYHIT